MRDILSKGGEMHAWQPNYNNINLSVSLFSHLEDWNNLVHYTGLLRGLNEIDLRQIIVKVFPLCSSFFLHVVPHSTHCCSLEAKSKLMVQWMHYQQLKCSYRTLSTFCKSILVSCVIIRKACASLYRMGRGLQLQVHFC